MTVGYCNQCQTPLVGNAWRLIGGKKLCAACIEQRESVQKRAKENDANKRAFFQYLLSLFATLKDVPEHWYTQLETMLKRGWTVKNIQNTLVYCGQRGVFFTEDNWSRVVYDYYNEAVAWVEKLKETRKKNDDIELVNNTVTVPFKSASVLRDMPSYKIEDL